MAENPFPGPQPYEVAERSRFFGRETLARNLLDQVMARSVTIVFGASGAGKSSLLRASILPTLEEAEGMRVVRVETWPADQEPLSWLAGAMFADLDLGKPEPENATERMQNALVLAAQYSDRPLLVFLDQAERLFTNEHGDEAMDMLLEGLAWLVQPRRSVRVHIVVAIREDYVGRFHDWTRDQPSLGGHGFHVRPLSVGEMVTIACQTAALGIPPQTWNADKIRSLMLDMRVQGQRPTEDAAIQAAFAQIVCHALWDYGGDERRRSGGLLASRAILDEELSAEAILHKYLDEKLREMGPLQTAARMLLEEHFIDQFGHRRLLRDSEAEALLPVKYAAAILAHLERAVILSAKEHQGSRYFELGHDWLAKKLLERRLERLRVRKLARVAVVAKVALVTVVAFALFLWFMLDKQRRAEDAAQLAGARELLSTHELSGAARILTSIPQPQRTSAQWKRVAQDVFLAGVPRATLRHCDVVYSAAWRPRKDPSREAAMQDRIVTGSQDGSVRIWTTNGKQRAAYPPEVQRKQGCPPKHEEKANQEQSVQAVSAVAWSHEGNRIFIGHQNGEARIWDGPAEDSNDAPKIYKLETAEGKSAHDKEITFAAWSPMDEKYVVTASRDGSARLWIIDSKSTQNLRTQPEEFVHSRQPLGDELQCACEEQPCKSIAKDALPIRSATWSPDGMKIATSSDDGYVFIWDVENGMQTGSPKCLQHNDYIYWAAWSANGDQIATASLGGRVVVWKTDSKKMGEWKVHRGFSIHEKSVWSADWSPLQGSHSETKERAPYGSDYVLTASDDRSLRIWSTQDEGDEPTPAEILNLGSATWAASWSPDGTKILAASEDNRAWIWDLRTLLRRIRYVKRKPEELDPVELNGDLEKSTKDCLTVEQRKTYLIEDEGEAWRGFEACEKARIQGAHP